MTERQKNSLDIEKWLKLIRAETVGPVTFAKLIKYFSSPDKVLGASVSQLARVEGVGFKSAEKIAASCDKFEPAQELELAEKLGVWIININDERYPELLKELYDPPPVLYIKGTLRGQDSLAVAIVGTRRCSLYGQEQASRFAHFLASAGFTIVSGMARGIDSSAHQGALSAEGRTIAVQGCGLSNVFPPENKKLFEMISSNGACISELPLEYEPLSENFPPRNRIIAGLSLGTIVVEAGYRSGALITARAALSANREVMAVPGKIDSPASKGSNRLIKDGAKLIEGIEDVIEALGYVGERLKWHIQRSAEAAEKAANERDKAVNLFELTACEDRTYKSLGKVPIHIEEVVKSAKIPVGKVSASLVSLRLKGLVKQLPGSFFARRG